MFTAMDSLWLCRTLCFLLCPLAQQQSHTCSSGVRDKTCLKFQSLTPFMDSWQPWMPQLIGNVFETLIWKTGLKSLSFSLSVCLLSFCLFLPLSLSPLPLSHTVPMFIADSFFFYPPTNKTKRLQGGRVSGTVWCPQQDTGSQKWRCKSSVGLQCCVKCGLSWGDFPLMQMQYINGKKHSLLFVCTVCHSKAASFSLGRHENTQRSNLLQISTTRLSFTS